MDLRARPRRDDRCRLSRAPRGPRPGGRPRPGPAPAPAPPRSRPGPPPAAQTIINGAKKKNVEPVKKKTAAVWCVPALRVPLVHS